MKLICDLFIDGGVILVPLSPEEIKSVLGTMDRFKLDFDDAYQYVAAERYNLIFVSYDKDFDRTEKCRKKPEELTS